MSGKQERIREIIAREIWAYQECPWDFDNVEAGSMAELQKRMALDQAERIRIALEKDKRERGRTIARFVFGARP